MQRFKFDIHAQDGAARAGTIRMMRGDIRTPAFMPVGTAATVKALKPETVRKTGADIILGNTYHLMLRPGAERVARLGGLHKFMNWPRPILTDSGGYQVMSLSDLRKLTEKGVEFRSHIDGSKHMLTPERSMEIQRLLGSDIVMAFDECPRADRPRDEIAASMEMSMRWARRSRDGFDAGGEMAHMNHLEPNLITALGFIGITRVHQIAIEGQEFGGELLATSVAQALDKVDALVGELASAPPVAAASTRKFAPPPPLHGRSQSSTKASLVESP